MPMYLTSLQTNLANSDGIVQEIINCQQGFELAMTFGVHQSPIQPRAQLK